MATQEQEKLPRFVETVFGETTLIVPLLTLVELFCFQIAQFILDESLKRNEICRIVCTQPRRISAVTTAERVAMERGESVGQTVGYQIRLESRC